MELDLDGVTTLLNQEGTRSLKQSQRDWPYRRDNDTRVTTVTLSSTHPGRLLPLHRSISCSYSKC
jgi:hypothetical protein